MASLGRQNPTSACDTKPFRAVNRQACVPSLPLVPQLCNFTREVGPYFSFLLIIWRSSNCKQCSAQRSLQGVGRLWFGGAVRAVHMFAHPWFISWRSGNCPATVCIWWSWSVAAHHEADPLVHDALAFPAKAFCRYVPAHAPTLHHHLRLAPSPGMSALFRLLAFSLPNMVVAQAFGGGFTVLVDRVVMGK